MWSVPFPGLVGERSLFCIMDDAAAGVHDDALRPRLCSLFLDRSLFGRQTVTTYESEAELQQNYLVWTLWVGCFAELDLSDCSREIDQAYQWYSK